MARRRGAARSLSAVEEVTGSAGEAVAESVTPAVFPVYEHYTMGLSLLQSGNPAQAAIRLEKARSAAPGKTSIREALGRAYFELHRLPEAESEFRAVLAEAPTNDYAHFALGRVLERRGRFQEAAVHRKLARAMSPGEPRYRGGLEI